jgi:hypothetical protein
MKWNFQFIILPAFLLAGCGTDKETLQFSDERPQPQGRHVDSLVPSSKKLDKQNLFKVELAVYGFLLQRHFWDNNEYTAVFLQGEDYEVDALIKQFPNHVPPVKTSDRVELSPNRTPIDKETGRPAMILSVDALDPVDDTVKAIGKWYAGGAVSGFYIFSLQKTGDTWVIESSK